MARSARRGSEGKRASRKTSVVGSTLGDAPSRLRARGVPQSGIRSTDTLKIAEGALPDSTMGPVDARVAGHRILRILAIVSGSLAGLLLLLALVLAILAQTPVFEIKTIETNDTEHVTAENVAQLIRVPEGSTLLNVDTEAVERSVLNNPWIGSVEIQSVFPDKLRVHAVEREVGALVSMRSGGMCWLLGKDSHWIEPMRVQATEDESAEDAALSEAERLGVIMISDIPSSVSPVAGTAATDSSLDAVMTFEEQLSDEFKQQIASYSAPDEEGIACILKNGVEVSLGSAVNIATKESVAQRILDEFAGQVTYVNVRVPGRPTYRRVESTYMREGTGATGTSIDEESKFSTYPQRDPSLDEDLNEGMDDELISEYATDATNGSSGTSARGHNSADSSSREGSEQSGSATDGSYDERETTGTRSTSSGSTL